MRNQYNNIIKPSTNGFTLVELLVVISIIALLLSILLPSLGRARDMARNITCQANSKQIGTLISVYQTDNQGFVPVILNKWAEPAVCPSVKTNNAFLSAALISYTNVKLPANLQNMLWFEYSADAANKKGYKEYITKYLPNYFVCPLNRGQSVVKNLTADSIKIGRYTYTSYGNGNGRVESYITWLWRWEKGYDHRSDTSTQFPSSAEGVSKYGNLVWHSAFENKVSNSVHPLTIFDTIKDRPVRWDNAKSINAGSLSEATVAFCQQGQHVSSLPYTIFNYGKHRKGNRGGTNAIFADTHVGWVDGMNIGWP